MNTANCLHINKPTTDQTERQIYTHRDPYKHLDRVTDSQIETQKDTKTHTTYSEPHTDTDTHIHKWTLFWRWVGAPFVFVVSVISFVLDSLSASFSLSRMLSIPYIYGTVCGAVKNLEKVVIMKSVLIARGAMRMAEIESNKYS